MARTASNMLPLGTPAADFDLVDTQGQRVRRDDFRGRPLVVAFICNHCPYVKHLRVGLRDFGQAYPPQKLAMVAINSNDAQAYPDDAPDRMAIEASAAGYAFPYLFDASQQVATAYQAACTPDFFLFDPAHRLVYRGQFDASRPGNDLQVDGQDLRRAVDAVLAGQPVAPDQRPSLGCGIKWRPSRTAAPATPSPALR